MRGQTWWLDVFVYYRGDTGSLGKDMYICTYVGWDIQSSAMQRDAMRCDGYDGLEYPASSMRLPG
jgi:hypothetical protein